MSFKCSVYFRIYGKAVENMVVKARKVGNSTTITIPSSFNIPENTEFEVKSDMNGNIIFSPVSTLSTNQTEDIHDFMDQFKPLMETLKDK